MKRMYNMTQFGLGGARFVTDYFHKPSGEIAGSLLAILLRITANVSTTQHHVPILREGIETLLARNEEKSSVIENMEANLAYQNEVIEENGYEIEIRNEQIERLNEELAAKDEVIAKMNEDLEEEREFVDQLRSSQDSAAVRYRQQIDELEDDVDDKSNEIVRLQVEQNRVNNDRNTKNTTIANLQNDRSRARREIQQLVAKVTDLEDDVFNKQVQIDELQASLSNIIEDKKRARLNEKRELLARDETIKKLEQENNRLRQDKKALSKGNTKLKKSVPSQNIALAQAQASTSTPAPPSAPVKARVSSTDYTNVDDLPDYVDEELEDSGFFDQSSTTAKIPAAVATIKVESPIAAGPTISPVAAPTLAPLLPTPALPSASFLPRAMAPGAPIGSVPLLSFGGGPREQRKRARDSDDEESEDEGTSKRVKLSPESPTMPSYEQLMKMRDSY